MSTDWRPIDGEEIVPTRPSAAAATEDIHAAEASGSPTYESVRHDDDDGSATRRPRARADNRLLMIGAILLVAIAQLVVGFLALSSINQLRDQTTAANGLQHCLIQAQLKQVASSNPAAYQSAVQACISR